MLSAFGKAAYSWQLKIIVHPSKMASIKLNLAPGAVFLCRPTGGGKYLVRDTYAASQGGIFWCITPLLSLSADQVSKINESSSQRGNGTVLAVNLDDYRTPEREAKIAEWLSRFTSISLLTVIVFSSPQAIVNSTIYQDIFQGLLDRKVLSGVCIDEAHLFVQFELRSPNLEIF
jgi:superfamily II DNA helicase RecQ